MLGQSYARPAEGVSALFVFTLFQHYANTAVCD